MLWRLLLFVSLLLLSLPVSAQLREPRKEILDHIQDLDSWLARLDAARRPSDKELLDAVDYANARAAIKLLEERGQAEAAKTLGKYLKDGYLYGGATAEGETSKVTNSISLRSLLLNPYRGDLSDKDYREKLKRAPVGPTRYSPLNQQQLIDLAATLFHEWVHTTQARPYRAFHGGRNVVPYNGDLAEVEAWNRTIEMLHGWSNEAFLAQSKEKDKARRIPLVKQAIDELAVLKQQVTAYLGNPRYWPSHNRAQRLKEWTDFRKTIEAQENYLRKLLGELEPKPKEDPEEGDGFGQLPPLLKTPSADPREWVPREGEVLVSLTGKGRASGHVFDLQIQNLAARSLTWSVPLGLVLNPGNPACQRMMIGEDTSVEVPPGQTVSVPLVGFCLDPQREPPPILTNSLLSGTDQPWSVEENFPEAAALAGIIRAGNELSAKGSFREIFPPQKHRETVIQRALWYERTRGTPEEMGKERMLRDLQEQFQAAGKNPPPEQVKEGADSIWNDVDLTLKKAGR